MDDYLSYLDSLEPLEAAHVALAECQDDSRLDALLEGFKSLYNEQALACSTWNNDGE